MRTSAVLLAILSGFVTFSTAAPVASAGLGDGVMGSILGSAVGNPGSANKGNTVGTGNAAGNGNQAGNGNGNGNAAGNGNKASADGNGSGNGNGNGSGNKVEGNTISGLNIGSVSDVLDVELPKEINVSPTINL